MIGQSFAYRIPTRRRSSNVKRKRNALKRSYPRDWQIRYIPNCVANSESTKLAKLDFEMFAKLETEFVNFVLLSKEDDAGKAGITGDAGGDDGLDTADEATTSS